MQQYLIKYNFFLNTARNDWVLENVTMYEYAMTGYALKYFENFAL